MTTLKDLAKGALSHLFVLEGQEEPEADELATALTTLRDVLARLPEYGGGRRLVDENATISVTANHDARLICAVSGLVITTPTEPKDGTRLAVAPLSGSVTVSSEDRKLESATASVVVSEPTTWVYRAEAIDWVKVTALADTDPSPYGDDCDSAIKYITAMEAADLFAAEITPALGRKIAEAQSYLRSKYHRPRDQDWRASAPYSVQGSNRLRGYR